MEQLRAHNTYLERELSKDYQPDEIVGAAPSLAAAMEQVNKVAPTASTVLLRGESGTGKELLARAIHFKSPRSGKAFVKVNCAALAPGVLESELFGHEKGSFTGALARKLGRFELADGGTLFLDEVGDLTLDIQVKLLRVLQEREFERVGGVDTIRTDVRVVSATNRDLEQAITRREFREDLYYRLNVFPVYVPRSASGPRTSSRWLNTSSSSTHTPVGSGSRASPTRRWRSSWATPGRATCVSWRT